MEQKKPLNSRELAAERMERYFKENLDELKALDRELGDQYGGRLWPEEDGSAPEQDEIPLGNEKQDSKDQP